MDRNKLYQLLTLLQKFRDSYDEGDIYLENRINEQLDEIENKPKIIDSDESEVETHEKKCGCLTCVGHEAFNASFED